MADRGGVRGRRGGRGEKERIYFLLSLLSSGVKIKRFLVADYKIYSLTTDKELIRSELEKYITFFYFSNRL